MGDESQTVSKIKELFDLTIETINVVFSLVQYLF